MLWYASTHSSTGSIRTARRDRGRHRGVYCLARRSRDAAENRGAERAARIEPASTVVWLCGPGASFVTGVVVPVDGEFSAFAGVSVAVY